MAQVGIIHQLLDHEPMSVYELGDCTGIPLSELDDTLTYMEGFDMVDYRQGYWVCPNQLDRAHATSSG